MVAWVMTINSAEMGEYPAVVYRSPEQAMEEHNRNMGEGYSVLRLDAWRAELRKGTMVHKLYKVENCF